MNCANHPDRERTAFCQNCGKPLCSECIRSVGSSTFCEPCLVARVAGMGAGPRAGYGFGVPPGAAPVVPGEPNPGIAALLGFIPGVGAMYNEQYGKGIVHLIVFAVLVSLANDGRGIFGLFVFGWIAYMVIEAHHTARARRDGTPLPNPFGLNDIAERLGFGKAWPGAGPVDPGEGSVPYTPPGAAYMPPGAPYTPPAAGANVPPANPYGPPYSYNYDYRYAYVPPSSQWGAPQATEVPPYADPNLHPNSAPNLAPNRDFFHRFPSGAVWLIVLGVIFLVGRTHIFYFHAHVLAPMLMIGFGVWLFVGRMMSTGHTLGDDGTHYYRWRLANAVHHSVWIVLTGVIWLLDVLHILSWGRSWPIYLIAVGVLVLFRRATEAAYVPYVAPPFDPAAAGPVAAAVPGTGLARTDAASGAHPPADGNDQEGR